MIIIVYTSPGTTCMPAMNVCYQLWDKKHSQDTSLDYIFPLKQFEGDSKDWNRRSGADVLSRCAQVVESEKEELN